MAASVGRAVLGGLVGLGGPVRGVEGVKPTCLPVGASSRGLACGRRERASTQTSVFRGGTPVKGS